MTTINLRDFYPWYTHDEFMEVMDEVAEELFIDKRYQKALKRQNRRYPVKALDLDDNIGTNEICSACTPEELLEKMDSLTQLCRALNSLPETQGRRIDAHYLLGMSVQEIAEADGTGERNVRKAIYRGLENMKKSLINFSKQGTEMAPNCPYK